MARIGDVSGGITVRRPEDEARAGGFAGPGAVSVGGTPPSLPDYYSLMNSDAMLAQQRGNLAAGSAADAGSRRAAKRALLMQYGGALQNFSDPYGDIDASVAQEAAANPHSIVKQIERAHQDSVAAARAALAGRGFAYSGQAGYEEGRAGQARSQSEYDAAQQAMAALTETNSNFARAEQQREAARLAAMAEAMQRQMMLNPPSPGAPGQTAQYDAALSSFYKVPVYKAADGSFYTLNQSNQPVAWTPPATSDPTFGGWNPDVSQYTNWYNTGAGPFSNAAWEDYYANGGVRL